MTTTGGRAAPAYHASGDPGKGVSEQRHPVELLWLGAILAELEGLVQGPDGILAPLGLSTGAPPARAADLFADIPA